jgi:iduronate 2-sulfatase
MNSKICIVGRWSALWMCVAWAASGATLRGAEAPRLNVLLIISDDLRDTVGCYGNTMAKTPNIDRMAARGVRFDRAYVQYPVCNPSRTSFLTGLRAEQTGVVDNGTHFRTRLPEVVTLPQLLREHGWYAAGFGKIFHLGGKDGSSQDHWMDLPRSWDEARAFHATAQSRVLEGRNLTGGKLKWCQWGSMSGTDDDQPDGQTAAAAIGVMETRGDRPWIIGAGFHRPHDPFLSPKKYFDLYSPGSLKLYHDPAEITTLPPLSLPGGFTEAFNAFTDQDRMEFQRAYYAGVSLMDAQVGRLLDAMDRLELWDRTVVIFLGDNGYHHNERNWWNKNTLFERSCRVPLIVCAPGVRGGQTCRSLVEMVDLYPTLVDYCGLTPPHRLAGETLRPLLEDASRPGRPAACTLVTRGRGQFGQSVRTDRWRFTRWSDGTAELYDEQADPEETYDLAKDSGLASVVKDLSARLDGLPRVPSPTAGK